jgi:uncharacterized protein (DUF488 family)
VTHAFYTIGHSNRSFEAFAALLQAADIRRVVDVRAFPRSRTNPQFNIEVLPESLASIDVSYEHLAALGGRRGKSSPVPVGLNDFWTHRSFHNYADYALSEPFRAGLAHLLAEGHQRRCAVMCSEAVWWRCHRRIITDYLMARGEHVFHILGPGQVEPAKLNEGAVVQSDGTIIYPAIEA